MFYFIQLNECKMDSDSRMHKCLQAAVDSCISVIASSLSHFDFEPHTLVKSTPGKKRSILLGNKSDFLPKNLGAPNINSTWYREGLVCCQSRVQTRSTPLLSSRAFGAPETGSFLNNER